MSLTEALRTGAPEAFGVLYDEHAEQLYAYCHIMVGDEAADSVRDAFIAAARHPGTAPSDPAALPVWLFALARAECLRRGSLVRRPTTTPSSDPLRRALARLRPEHREALALSTTLEPVEIARVIGVAADTAEMLVRVSARRLEQAAVSVLGGVHNEAMLAALSAGNLDKLVMRGYSLPPRQRERVLTSCAAAERAPDGALLFDADGMPIPLDALFGRAEEPTHPFAQVEDSSAAVATAGVATIRVSHARPKKEPFLSRRRDGLVEVAGLAACVAAATSVLALWPSPHNNGASNMDGTSLFMHRSAPASRSAQPVPQGGNAMPPPQAATSKPGASPTPSSSSAAPADAPATTPPSQPAPPPVAGHGPSPSHPAHPTHPTHPAPPTSPPDSPPSSTPTPDPTPTPTDSPTDPPPPDPSTPSTP
ncbi:sigma-70 family RNA polymerase sigma factor [Actinomadura sp. DC4]|uniref:RNA polymerase sigma factor n=1 Tax=Actinomadura sp. DC4 TaxID=3055069 RepID=UPI0025AF8AC9|nr:sigma-70 family RNA polymerase sigma factor [Actinomadura sp. DC4]MDN3356937.1 sigma-70 family RNA polymerase sigma factor [Actinomadura sp. DC4]